MSNEGISSIYKVKGLALLDILIDEGACMTAPPDHNQTPSRPTGRPNHGRARSEAQVEYNRDVRAATAFCMSCSVKLECAIYSRANGAAPINGNNVIGPAERKQRDRVLETKGSFDQFVLDSVKVREQS